MRASDRISGNQLTLVLHDSGVRTGACAGAGLAAVLVSWLYVASRVPALERVALQRNLIAVSILVLFFLAPVVRFLWQPGRLLVSSLIAWSILSITYGGLCIHFDALANRYSAMQVFTLGAIVCMILATLSWIGACIWRSRELHMSSHRVSHSNRHP